MTADAHSIDRSRLAISADALHRLLRLEALRPTHASDLPRVALADCLGLAHAAAGASLRSISTVGSVETSRRRLERARAWGFATRSEPVGRLRWIACCSRPLTLAIHPRRFLVERPVTAGGLTSP
jgi:hypothetical protein